MKNATSDFPDNMSYIYYKGKLVTFHVLNENTVIYHENHGKISMEKNACAQLFQHDLL